MLGEFLVWEAQTNDGEWVKVRRIVEQPLEDVSYFTPSNPAFILFTAGCILSKYGGALDTIPNWGILPGYQRNLLQAAWDFTKPMFLPELGFIPFAKTRAPPIILVDSLSARKRRRSVADSTTPATMPTRSKTASNREKAEFVEFPVENHNNDAAEWVDPADLADDWYDPIDDWGRRLLPEAQRTWSPPIPDLPTSPPRKPNFTKVSRKRKTPKGTMDEADSDNEGSFDGRVSTPTPPVNKKPRKATTKAVAPTSRKRPAKRR